MGLQDGISEKKLKSMNPLVSEMRKIYGRPKLKEIYEASISRKVSKYWGPWLGGQAHLWIGLLVGR